MEGQITLREDEYSSAEVQINFQQTLREEEHLIVRALRQEQRRDQCPSVHRIE